MVHYSDLGLVNTNDLFKKAIEGKYAIPAFNFNNMEQLQAIVAACVETNSPVILQVSSGARKYANQTLLRYMAQGAVEYAKELGKNIPIVLHLDHGDTFELCKSCIDSGFSSVMIDGSHHSYEDNIALTKKVVESAQANGYTVLITADHGNADFAVNADGTPNTAHSLNPVPFVVVDKDVKEVKNGVLADIAPTVLKLMGITIPAEVTGKVLI
jgi:hypothetical protein